MSTPDVSAAAMMEDASPDETELPLGFLVGGKYRIKRVLGKGGNGAVYEGQHAAVGHRVAIKVAHPSHAERKDVIARFQREAQTCGSLQHPNVGQIYDVGTLDDGAPYMVMELLEGRSLADVIDETKMPVAAIIEIVRQVLAGLAAAHRSGTIHRDIKPDNVMIVRDHSGDTIAKLVDFGISKPIVPNKSAHSVTDEGMIVGSPDYMSPEQLRGDALDVRTDLYSAGVLLYEALTGRLPFDHENVADLFASILRDPVTRPSVFRPDCPEELELATLKALARDPAARYQTAEEMSRALAEVRASSRGAPSGLERFDESPRSSGVRTQRRRTIDTRTLDGIRVQTGTLPSKPRAMPWLALGTGVVATLSVAAWLLASGDQRQPVVATPITATVGAQPRPLPPTAAAAANVAETIAAPQPEAKPANTVMAAPPTPVSKEAQAAKPPQREAAAAPPETRAKREAGPQAPAKPVATITPTPRAEPARANVDVQALMRQASSAYLSGRSAQARSLYQQVVKSAPQQADAWRGLGLAASKTGERFEATRAFQRYLALRPNASDAQRIREQLAKVQVGSP